MPFLRQEKDTIVDVPDYDRARIHLRVRLSPELHLELRGSSRGGFYSRHLLHINKPTIEVGTAPAPRTRSRLSVILFRLFPVEPAGDVCCRHPPASAPRSLRRAAGQARRESPNNAKTQGESESGRARYANYPTLT